MYRRDTPYTTVLLVFGLAFLTLTGSIAYYATVPVATQHTEKREKTEEIYDDDFSVDEEEYKGIRFTLDKGVDCEVSWEWDVKDDDMVINFYLMDEDEYENWKDEEDFDYIRRIKRENDAEGVDTLGDGEYVFLFNNADETEEVEIEFEVNITWEEDYTVTGSRGRYELHFPMVVSSLVTLVCFSTLFGIKYPDSLGSLFERLTERLGITTRRDRQSWA